MDLTLTVALDITPGTYTEDQITADVQANIEGLTLQLGFTYGPEIYTVNSATVTVD